MSLLKVWTSDDPHPQEEVIKKKVEKKLKIKFKVIVQKKRLKIKIYKIIKVSV